MNLPGKPPNYRQRLILQRRQMDCRNYRVIRDDYDKMYLLDLRYNKIKIVHKHY